MFEKKEKKKKIACHDSIIYRLNRGRERTIKVRISKLTTSEKTSCGILATKIDFY
jgi:hypothetical protein